MRAFSSEQALITASREASKSVAPSGMGRDQSASASRDGVGREFCTKKSFSFAVFLAISVESSMILFGPAMAAIDESSYRWSR